MPLCTLLGTSQDHSTSWKSVHQLGGTHLSPVALASDSGSTSPGMWETSVTSCPWDPTSNRWEIDTGDATFACSEAFAHFWSGQQVQVTKHVHFSRSLAHGHPTLFYAYCQRAFTSLGAPLLFVKIRVCTPGCFLKFRVWSTKHLATHVAQYRNRCNWVDNHMLLFLACKHTFNHIDS